MPKTIIQRTEKYSMQSDVPLRTPPCRTFSLVVLVSWTDVVHPRFLLFILWFWPQNGLLFVLLMSQYPLLDRSQGPKLTKNGAYLTTKGWVGLARPGNPEMPGFFGHSFPEQLALSWQESLLPKTMELLNVSSVPYY